MKTATRKLSVIGWVMLALVIAACGGGTPGPSGSNVPDVNASQSFAVSGDVTVSITTYAGDIKVTAGAAGQVQVQVIKHGGGATDAAAKTDLENIQLSLNQTSGKITLLATHRGAVPNNSSASFVVVVPAGSTIVATNDDGKVSIDGVTGGVTASTTSGDIAITNSDKNDLVAKTTNGNVTLSGKLVTSVRASTSNGNVSFSGSFDKNTAANRLDVGNGNASLTLPGDAQFGIDASTANGTLASDFTFQGTNAPDSVKGTLGSTPTFGIVIRVKNGTVTIKKG
jgi:DUF4097 and DUF4098 domain-containing protein YvlB